MQDLLSFVKESDEMIQEMYRLTIIGIIKAKVIYRIEKYIIYIDILVWGGGILNIEEMRGDSVMRKKRLTAFMRIALINSGSLI